jgi:diadenosine tetraphosphate (Ap4A) HIT family hydrolase
MSEPESHPRCGICARIKALRSEGRAADLVAELEHSWVVLGDAQYYRGYCVILAKTHATELYRLPPAEAHALFDEQIAVGKAIAGALNPRKLNYECLGNAEPHVHWHVFPRYEGDPGHKGRVEPEHLKPLTLEPTDQASVIKAIASKLHEIIPSARIPSGAKRLALRSTHDNTGGADDSRAAVRRL